MAYDEKLAGRIRESLGTRAGLSEKKMFGGLAFLINGNMSVGVHGDAVIIRLEPHRTEDALGKPHTRVFNLSGRPMKGWILVDHAGVASTSALRQWIDVGVAYAESLPPKR
jgi:hypothetical protein